MRKALAFSILIVVGFAVAFLAGPALVRALGGRRTIGGLEFVFEVVGGFSDDAERSETLRVLRKRCEMDPLGRFASSRIEGNVVTVAIPRPATDEEMSAWREMIVSSGELTLRTVADQKTNGFDYESERERIDRWLDGSIRSDFSLFNALDPSQGGPTPVIEWFAMPASPRSAWSPVACERAAQSTLRFTIDDLTRAEPAVDGYGDPSLWFELGSNADSQFAAFTGARVHRKIAFGLGDQVLTAPILSDPLTGPTIVGAFLSPEARDDWLHVLRSGRLPVRLHFVEVRPTPKR